MPTIETIIVYYLPFEKGVADFEDIKSECDEFKENFGIIHPVLPSFTGQEGYTTIPYEIDTPQLSQPFVGVPYASPTVPNWPHTNPFPIPSYPGYSPIWCSTGTSAGLGVANTTNGPINSNTKIN